VVLLALTLVLVAGSAVLLQLTWNVAEGDAIASSPSEAISLFRNCVFVLAGTALVVRRPANFVGWLLLALGASGTALIFLSRYAVYGVVVEPDSLPTAAPIAALSTNGWLVQLLLMNLLLLVYPSGKLESARWRWFACAMVIGPLCLMVLLSAAPGELADPFFVTNPIGFEALADLMPVIDALVLVLLLGIVVSITALLQRFRRSSGVERDQYKWFVYTAAFVVALVVLNPVLSDSFLSLVQPFLELAIAALPVAIGIAILRHNLYDIDRIINRTLVYALLTAGLAATYFGLVVGLQAVLRSVSGGSDLAIVVTTLIVAALFLPARRRVQDAVDRRFNRRAYDAARTVENFSARLREQIDLDTLRYELLAVVDDTMAPARVSVWLRNVEVQR
jgi:hypothetical protein